ncbi:MAG: hypothetical protein U0587_01060 [Candidatus Binatia bacterium]
MTSTTLTHEGAIGDTRELESGGSLTQAIGGAAAIVLSILGLVHVESLLLASIATIVVGASFLIAGSALVARYSKFLSKSESHVANEVVGEGMAMESLGGAAGIVLGILSLVGAGATTLLPVAAIVFGGSLLLASGTAFRLNAATAHRGEDGGEVLDFSAGPGVLIALSGIVLGVLALAGISPIVLSLAAMLSFGVAVLVSGASLASMMTKVFAA